jgi:hypothetical protein
MYTQVRVTLPDFIEEDVALWWAQVEARLNLAQITDDKARFRYVISALPSVVAKKISDLVFEEPKTEPFKVLRERIAKEFEPSDNAQLRQLLEECQLGDDKPSALLQRMRKRSNFSIDYRAT